MDVISSLRWMLRLIAATEEEIIALVARYLLELHSV